MTFPPDAVVGVVRGTFAAWMAWWSTALTWLGGASAVVAGATWLVARVIDHRLTRLQQASLQQLTHEQSKALETIRHEQSKALETIRLENQTAIEGSKSLEQKVLAQLNSALSIYSIAVGATGAKRVDAIERVWLAVVELRRWPGGLSMIDFVTAEEYEVLPKTHPKEWEALKQSCHAYIEGRHPPEQVRPFVGEGVWQRYLGYWQFMMRVAVVTSGYAGGGHKPWYTDDLALRILGAILPKSDLDAVLSRPLGQLRAMTDLLDLAVLAESEHVLSGRSSSAQSLDQVRAIARQVAAAEAEFERPS